MRGFRPRAIVTAVPVSCLWLECCVRGLWEWQADYEKGAGMDAESMTNINASRERLRQFVSRVSDDELARSIEREWTGAALLAHTAFWDRRAAWLVRRCQQGACAPSPDNLDAINESALPQWRLIPPRAAAQEALDAAEEIDGLVVDLPDELLTELRQNEIRYDRSRHRNEHLDQIERVLARQED